LRLRERVSWAAKRAVCASLVLGRKTDLRNHFEDDMSLMAVPKLIMRVHVGETISPPGYYSGVVFLIDVSFKLFYV
jgi:hypothetical protein